MAKTISGIVAWLKNWFYDKTEINGFITTINTNIGNKVEKNQQQANKNVITDSTGLISLEPQLNVASGSGLSLNASTKALSHTNVVENNAGNSPTILSWNTHGHITNFRYMYGTDITLSETDSTKITAKINSLASDISNLQSFKFIEIGTSKPSTASASTMGKLYIVSETIDDVAKVNVYYTKSTTSGGTTTYSWEELDANILDSLTINWSDIQNKPDTFTPSSHTHGNLQNNGTVKKNGTLQNSQNIVTDASGNLTTESKSHATSATTYGVGTTANYGHNKVIDSLDKSTFANGESLSAHQGYVLNDAITTHGHGNITNDGKLAQSVNPNTANKIVVADSNDNYKMKIASGIMVSQVSNTNSLPNIGASLPSQLEINDALNTKIGDLSDDIDASTLTSIVLVPYADDQTGAIMLYYGDEPSSS